MKVCVRFAVLLCVCVCVLSCNTGKVNVPTKAVVSDDTALASFDEDESNGDSLLDAASLSSETDAKTDGVLVPGQKESEENPASRLPFDSYEVGIIGNAADTDTGTGENARPYPGSPSGGTDGAGSVADADSVNGAGGENAANGAGKETPVIKEIELQTPPVIVTDLKEAETPPIPEKKPAVTGSDIEKKAPVIEVKKESATPKPSQSVTPKPTQPQPPKQNEQKPLVPTSAVTQTAQSTAPKEEEPLPAVNEEVPPLPFEAISENAVPADTITPSRSATVSVNQYLDVVYPGAGWVYLGEIDESKALLSFANRKLENADTNFVLRGKKAGVTILHFYKQDVLSGTYIDDYLEVIVANDVYTGKDHRVAPSYADIVPPHQRKYSERAETAASQSALAKEAAEKLSAERIASVKTESPVTATPSAQNTVPPVTQKAPETKPASSNTQAVNKTIQINESSPQKTQNNSVQNGGTQKAESPKKDSPLPQSVSDWSIDQLLSEANKAYKNGKLNDSLAYVNVFFKKATTRLDEGLYLKGQLYESSKAEFRNIRTALDSYQELVDRYPSSALWKQANKRITYINRFYFNIR